MRLKTLKQCLDLLGLVQGLKFFVQIKLKLKSDFELSVSSGKLKIRPDTSDFMVFEQIFLERQYDIDYPSNARTIIDAGANTGMSAVYLAERFSDAEIVAIEPESGNYETLVFNTSVYSGVRPKNKALWYEETTLNIFDQGLKEWAFVTRQSDGHTENGVGTVRIAGIMSEMQWEVVDVLKIDIEGSEKEVFENGVDEWLPKVRCLIIELHDNYNPGASSSVLNAIKKYNFTGSVHGENHIFHNQNLQ